MVEHSEDSESDESVEKLKSRRAVLKVLAAAPLFFTFSLVASPLMRFLKPTMKPGNLCQPIDAPTADETVRFSTSDFPDVYNCLPFTLPLKYVVFNPEKYTIREVPGFVIRVGADRIVAFSRHCPTLGCNQILNYICPAQSGSCGCPDKSCIGRCIGYAKLPSLICKADGSVFDVQDGGRVVNGPASRPPRQFIVERDQDWISINRLEYVSIA